MNRRQRRAEAARGAKLREAQAEVASAQARIRAAEAALDETDAQLAEELLADDPNMAEAVKVLARSTVAAVTEFGRFPFETAADGTLIFADQRHAEQVQEALASVLWQDHGQRFVELTQAAEDPERVARAALRALARRAVRWNNDVGRQVQALERFPPGTAKAAALEEAWSSRGGLASTAAAQARGLGLEPSKPWDLDEDLDPAQRLDLAMLTDAARLSEVRKTMERAGLDTTKQDEALRRLKRVSETARALLLDPARTPEEKLTAVRLYERVAPAIEAVVSEGRRLAGLLDETDEDVARTYAAVKAVALGSDGGPLAEMQRTAATVRDMVRERGLQDIEHAPESQRPIGFRGAFAGLCTSWSDQALMSLGLGLWNGSYKLLDRTAAEDLIGARVELLYKDYPGNIRKLADSFAQFAALWAHDAFQKLVTTHTYAAALMCSDASREALGELHLPWRAFMVAVPDGLLRVEAHGRVVDYSRILVWSLDDGTATLAIYDKSEGRVPMRALMNGAPNLADLLFDPPDDWEWSSDVGAAEKRVARLAQRLVTGLLVALLYTQDFRRPKQKTQPHGSSARVQREPEHRVTFVGRPLKIDARAKVAAFLAKPGGRKDAKAPAVQFMVRGHHKRQVIGVGRTGRKVIWIEPYWKGAEDAPILTKPRLVTS